MTIQTLADQLFELAEEARKLAWQASQLENEAFVKEIQEDVNWLLENLPKGWRHADRFSFTKGYQVIAFSPRKPETVDLAWDGDRPYRAYISDVPRSELRDMVLRNSDKFF